MTCELGPQDEKHQVPATAVQPLEQSLSDLPQGASSVTPRPAVLSLSASLAIGLLQLIKETLLSHLHFPRLWLCAWHTACGQ